MLRFSHVSKRRLSQNKPRRGHINVSQRVALARRAAQQPGKVALRLNVICFRMGTPIPTRGCRPARCFADYRSRGQLRGSLSREPLVGTRRVARGGIWPLTPGEWLSRRRVLEAGCSCEVDKTPRKPTTRRWVGDPVPLCWRCASHDTGRIRQERKAAPERRVVGLPRALDGAAVIHRA